MLTINNKLKFRILECEFYIDDKYVHRDTYAAEIVDLERRMTPRRRYLMDMEWTYLPEVGLFLSFGGDEMHGRILIRSLGSLSVVN